MIRKFLLLLLALTLVLGPFGAQPASASFNKNKLIDDSLFIDTDSMTVSDIQAFLNEQGGFLKTWRDTVDMPKPDSSCIVHKATNKTAAQIIWEAANDWHAQYITGCGTVNYYDDNNLKTISPKALLVTLQKEQSLITATGSYSTTKSAFNDPACCGNNYKLAWAMGYGVPDTGGKNHTKKGFYNQVMYAAWQLRYNYERSGGNVDWEVYPDDDVVGYWIYSGPYIKGNHKRCKWYIDGNGDTRNCSYFYFDGYYPIDGQSLYMGNRATASLYYYTPHTYPGYTGNYNFVQFYEDWFGPVHLPTYKSRLIGKSIGFGIKPGQSKEVFLAYRNIGTGTWYDATGAPDGVSPTVLATSHGLLRNSVFNGQFDREDRPSVVYSRVYESDGDTLAANQHRVRPNQIVKFIFNMVAPMDINGAKTFEEWFEPLKQPSKTMNGDVSISATVPSLDIDGEIVKTSGLRGGRPGWVLSTFVKFKNTGNVVWYDNDAAIQGVEPLMLGTARPNGRISRFGAAYELPNRASSTLTKVYASNGTTLADNQHTVRPGEIAVWRFDMTVPHFQPGVYREWLGVRFAGAPGLTVGPDIPLDIKVLSAD